jgi:hypothetical protein
MTEAMMLLPFARYTGKPPDEDSNARVRHPCFPLGHTLRHTFAATPDASQPLKL